MCVSFLKCSSRPPPPVLTLQHTPYPADWKNPGPFAHYIFQDKVGVFLGVWYAFPNALFAYIGTEVRPYPPPSPALNLLRTDFLLTRSTALQLVDSLPESARTVGPQGDQEHLLPGSSFSTSEESGSSNGLFPATVSPSPKPTRALRTPQAVRSSSPSFWQASRLLPRSSTPASFSLSSRPPIRTSTSDRERSSVSLSRDRLLRSFAEVSKRGIPCCFLAPPSQLLERRRRGCQSPLSGRLDYCSTLFFLSSATYATSLSACSDMYHVVHLSNVPVHREVEGT